MYCIYKSLIFYEDYIMIICTTPLFIILTNKFSNLIGYQLSWFKH